MFFHQIFVFLVLYILCNLQQMTSIDIIDCENPPPLVDPALCCRDGGRDVNTENCAKRLGILKDGEPPMPTVPMQPPTVETATCLAECILNESGYMQQNEQLIFDTIRIDLQRRFSNDSTYIEAMYSAFQKCLPSAQQKMLTFKTMPLNNFNAQHGCSPFSGILLGCAYMEYFKNCPPHRWTESKQCALAKQFVKQCGLGA